MSEQSKQEMFKWFPPISPPGISRRPSQNWWKGLTGG